MSRAAVQILQFLAAIGIGFCLGLLYDFYRVWLRRGVGRLVTAIGDALFTCVALGGTFWVLLWLNKAEVRFYILLAIAVGAIIYLKVCSPVVLPFLQKLFHGISRVAKALFKIAAKILTALFMPFVWLSALLYRVCYFLFSLFAKIGRRVKKACGFAVNRGRGKSGNFKKCIKKALPRFRKTKKEDL